MHHAGLRNDHILLLVDSPVWATRARIDETRILAAVHSAGVAARSVKAKVVPLAALRTDSATARRLSPRTAEALRAAATTITDPDLRAALLELAGPPATPS